VEEESTPDGDSSEPKFVAIGARVGRSGQVFETDGRAGVGALVVKLFTWAAGSPAEAVREFTRDVMRVADLRHPHVAQVFDVGVLGDGTPFVVMERLAGVTLDEVASGKSSLPTAEVLPLLRGVGSALSAAHAAGVAHAQLRADNVFVANQTTYGRGCTKLLDFGVARLLAGARETGRGANALGQRAAERADQLALATLAWRLLGPTSAPVQLVLLRAMSPDPSQRFGSVAALVEALEEASVKAPPTGFATKASATRTLAGPSPPISAGRLPPPIVVAPPSAPATAPPLQGVPTPVLATAPSSLTQQFFAAGEQLEMAHQAGRTSDAGSVAEGDEEGEGEIETAAAARVPRSRAQMAAVALLALGSVALIGWTVVSLVSKPEGGQGATIDTAAVTAVSRPVAASPAGALRPARPSDRGPGGKTSKVRQTPSVQPPPFAARAKPSVTGSDAPAPPRLEVPPIQAPRPWVGAPPPSAVSTERNDDETEPAEQTGDESRGAGPAASTPEAPSVAPAAPGDESAAAPTPEAPAPSAAAPSAEP